MGGADAARIRVRGEGEPLSDPHQASARYPRWDRALLRATRAATRVGPVRPRAVAAPGELPPRRRAPGGMARAARFGTTRPAHDRVPPRELVRAGGDAGLAGAGSRADDRGPSLAAVPAAPDDGRLDVR